MTGEEALEIAQHKPDVEGRGPVFVALALGAAFVLQHCYDPNKAPPIDPSPISTVSPDVRARDAGGDR
jgi:hypothetical protein